MSSITLFPRIESKYLNYYHEYDHTNPKHMTASSPEINALIHNILTYYQQKETASEQPCFKYYEKLTDHHNKLVFTSALSQIECLVIMHLFHTLYEDDYYMFSENWILIEITNMEKDYTEKNIPKHKQIMFEEYDATTWIKYLEKIVTRYEEDKLYYEGPHNPFHFDERVNITSIEPILVGRHQKVYTLVDILALVPNLHPYILK
jgi:hypothetical protein